MGFFNGLMGNASEIDAEEVREKYSPMLMRGEMINQAYKIIRDMWIFTNCRLIIVNVQGMTGKKVEYHSIPYNNITHFAVESAGNFDLDAELKIWVNGMGTEAITQKFSTDTNIYKIQALLAAYVMG